MSLPAATFPGNATVPVVSEVGIITCRPLAEAPAAANDVQQALAEEQPGSVAVLPQAQLALQESAKGSLPSVPEAEVSDLDICDMLGCAVCLRKCQGS